MQDRYLGTLWKRAEISAHVVDGTEVNAHTLNFGTGSAF